MKVQYSEMLSIFKEILIKYGFSEEKAEEAAAIFADNSLSGVLSHGVNRFARVIKYIEDGDIKIDAEKSILFSSPFFERWDCALGLGPLFAKDAVKRSEEMALQCGLGIVALKNNNHWMRGGYYAEMAAKDGFIGICWSNTTKNMPPWGAKDARIGNNPLCIGVPVKDGPLFLLDMAISQYSYGKLETLRLKGEHLPYPGGFDKSGNLTDDPGKIEESQRILPIGYWKGSGLSIALDLIVSILSEGNSVGEIADFKNEIALSQLIIAIKSELLGIEDPSLIARKIVDYTKSGEVAEGFRSISYPGESMARIKERSEKEGIEVDDGVWKTILSLV